MEIRRLDMDNPREREAFCEFVPRIWPGLDFSAWYRRKLMEPGYQPYSAFEDGRLVANVSCTPMSLLVAGQRLAGLQLGTVATLPECRGQGLSRRLIEHVLALHEAQVDLVFLFANESVVDFYPRLGFRRVREQAFSLASPGIVPAFSGRRLDPSRDEDLALMLNLVLRRLPVSDGFCVLDCPHITLFHLIEAYPGGIVHLPEDEALVVLSEEPDCTRIVDLVLTRPVADSRALLAKAMESVPVRLEFGFTPDRLGLSNLVSEPNQELFFVRGDFPLEGKAFTFPLTMHT